MSDSAQLVAAWLFGDAMTRPLSELRESVAQNIAINTARGYGEHEPQYVIPSATLLALIEIALATSKMVDVRPLVAGFKEGGEFYDCVFAVKKTLPSAGWDASK